MFLNRRLKLLTPTKEFYLLRVFCQLHQDIDMNICMYKSSCLPPKECQTCNFYNYNNALIKWNFSVGS